MHRGLCLPCVPPARPSCAAWPRTSPTLADQAPSARLDGRNDETGLPWRATAPIGGDRHSLAALRWRWPCCAPLLVRHVPPCSWHDGCPQHCHSYSLHNVPYKTDWHCSEPKDAGGALSAADWRNDRHFVPVLQLLLIVLPHILLVQAQHEVAPQLLQLWVLQQRGKALQHTSLLNAVGPLVLAEHASNHIRSICGHSHEHRS